MLFSSLTFLLFYLPIVMGVYSILPKAWRNGFLLAASLFFYGWNDWRFLCLLLLEISIGFFSALGMQLFCQKRKILFWTSIVFIVGFLVYFKYFNFLAQSFASLIGINWTDLNIVLPLGISFYTFQILSYLIDVYQNKVTPLKNWIDFACYISMFCQLVAGPIVRYQSIQNQLHNRTLDLHQTALGIGQFVCGLAKKVLIANELYSFCQGFLESQSPSVLYLWAYAIGNVLYIYYDFSGYSDMAIGLGKMLGFSFPENFNYPLFAKSVSDFWRRWHISLTTWFREYVYIPLGGNRKGKANFVRNLLIVWLLTGIWHGASWNFVVWGLYFFVFILAEKLIWPNVSKIPVINHLYTLLAAIVGFLLFSCEDLSLFWQDLKCLFFAGNMEMCNTSSLYFLKSYAWLFVFSITGSLPCMHQVYVKIKTKVDWIQPVGMAAVLILCIASLVAGSWNPFLYFRF